MGWELRFANVHLRRALELRRERRHEEALVELNLACEENDGFSLFVKAMARWYGGWTQARDAESAMPFLERSALAGCPSGIFWHGCFGRMKETERDKWYKKALATKDSYAWGMCFFNGLGVGRNREKALECFLVGCREDNPLSQTAFGMYRLGSDEKEQFFWVEKAAEFGDGVAQYFAGRYCGAGVEKDQERAFRWFFEGAKQNNHLCCLSLAMCCEKGTGCSVDLPLSAKYYLAYGMANYITKRLKFRNSNEQVQLQEMFVYGEGLKKNKKLCSEVVIVCSAIAIRVYDESSVAARRAALFFVWICKQNNFLVKDLVCLIGKLIWDSRSDPFAWNVRKIKK